ncbi:hypothetical protein SAY87_007701 [Trapa incisa]|uniref:Uncharacterized protein n=1 Tax=Trapa incisa TaxID=236973 RepID=A0AAN7KEU4_9MYRT|nr:hypothetical protein SAY87_007701 [Trapa incisa]
MGGIMIDVRGLVWMMSDSMSSSPPRLRFLLVLLHLRRRNTSFSSSCRAAAARPTNHGNRLRGSPSKTTSGPRLSCRMGGTWIRESASSRRASGDGLYWVKSTTSLGRLGVPSISTRNWP